MRSTDLAEASRQVSQRVVDHVLNPLNGEQHRVANTNAKVPTARICAELRRRCTRPSLAVAPRSRYGCVASRSSL